MERDSPLLASPQGGVAERSKNIAKHPLIAKPGWFSDRNKRKTTPAASVLMASQNFLDDAATPPCGDARRGLLRSSDLFTPSLPRVDFVSRPCRILRTEFTHKNNLLVDRRKRETRRSRNSRLNAGVRFQH